MKRSFTILLFFAVGSIPATPAKRINVKQLEQTAVGLQNRSDLDATRQLAGFELSERMTTRRLEKTRSILPGNGSRQELTALADAASVLKLPAEDVLPDPPLPKEEQRKILTLASTYVEKTLARLPNFFATEAITLFEDTPPAHEGANSIAFRPIHFQSRHSATVLYRAGKEVMETRSGEIVEKDQLVSATAGLLSSGEFGPVLSTVLADAQKGKLAWSHWENGAAAPMAVFQYSVPRKQSHYKVKVEIADRSEPSQSRPGYHGEIGIDPATGTVLRLTLRADMTDDDPLGIADLVVEYGPVTIGGISYICPVRSVAIVVSSPLGWGVRGEGFNAGLHAPAPERSKDLPTQTLVNDVIFEHYHLLRSDARILTGADMENDKNSP